MKTREEILDMLRSSITEVIDIDRDEIIFEASLRDDLRADSLASVEIVMALEDAFGIEIEEEKAAALRTVADLVDAVALSQPNAATVPR